MNKVNKVSNAASPNKAVRLLSIVYTTPPPLLGDLYYNRLLLLLLLLLYGPKTP